MEITEARDLWCDFESRIHSFPCCEAMTFDHAFPSSHQWYGIDAGRGGALVGTACAIFCGLPASDRPEDGQFVPVTGWIRLARQRRRRVTGQQRIENSPAKLLKALTPCHTRIRPDELDPRRTHQLGGLPGSLGKRPTLLTTHG
jgi:hypothetical protein